ncbi:uncharacterized protein TRAVEDRAFT_50801 [Trametes versicolor FP-101664 SS1]|uniref:uncharacterized protein n=1 Tax=Trametes versicolor (strain FP-101664) TaxID=717944 RepID=UPI0004621B81|nr:uncharacterized protein TRAVEDRAFT_50801 [Trametes versicolor FP-101664 SS1]EIW54662.1 hypothetical protein TRAVEDRAFT_50801 [Trametes versicolor FP-101664 SS1]
MSLDSPLPSPGLGQATHLNVALQKDSIGEMIKQEITQLRQHIGTIRELFRKVVGPLEEFDDEYLGSDPSTQLAPEWESLQKLFDACVDNSRHSAAAATTMMRAYADAVLGSVGRINCDKIEKHTRAAQQARANFKDLGENVQKFERKIKRTVKRLNIPIDAIMIKTCENIGNLKQKVAATAVITFSSQTADHPAQITDQESGFLAKMAACAPNAAQVLCTLSPMAALRAMRVACVGPATNEDTQRERAQAELEQCAAQMPMLLERNRIPPALRPYYQEWWANTQEDIHAVSKRIEAIARIWDHLHVDLTELETNLEVCSMEENVSQSIFLMEKIDVSRTVFSRLTECLELYAHQVSLY